MYCSKCGIYIESGEICAQCASAGGQTAPETPPVSYDYSRPKGGAGAFAVKILALVMAILAFALQFSDLITQKKSRADKEDYEEYEEKKEYEERKDYYNDDDYMDTESYGLYNTDDKEGGIDTDRLSYAKKFLEWAFLAFALYLGTFAASFCSKNEKLHTVFQGLFFSLMFCAFLFVWFSTFTGEVYYDHYLGDGEYAYYSQGVGITFAWVCAALSSLAGLVLTVVGAKGLNKK